MSKVDLTYNDDVREVEMKLNFHFDNEVVSIDKDDYLVEVNILEETGSGDSWVLGDLSSNEISIKLMNENGRFTPTNESGPYYGQIKSGIKIIPSIRVNGGNWLKMGEYYVDEWSAGVTDSYANIVAYDRLYQMFDSKPVGLPVYKNTTYKEFYTSILSGLNLTPKFGSNMDDTLTWGYMLNANAETLQKLTQSLMAVCSCDKDGDIYIRKVTGGGEPVATFKDSDQIITIDAEHNINSKFDGSLITYNTPRESRSGELFSAQDIPVSRGVSKLGRFQFSQAAVTTLEGITSELDVGGELSIVDVEGDSKSIQITVDEGTHSNISDLAITGKHVIENKISIGEETPNVLELENEFIQSRGKAMRFKNILDNTRGLGLYEVSVDIRGNPTVDVGDIVRIYSPLFNLDFKGIIKRAEYTYDGALSGKLVVINVNLVGEV